MSYTDVDWTAEQVDFTLRMLIDRIVTDPTSVNIEEDRYTKHNYTIKSGSKVYVSIDSERVFMILDNAAGSFRPSFFFWNDRAVKATWRELHSALKNRSTNLLKLRQEKEARYKKEVSMKALFDAFPEAIAQEFEKHVLESKDGKSEES